MPFLDIAIAQTSFQNHIYAFGPQTLFPGTCVFENERRFSSSWKTFHSPGKAKNPTLERVQIRRGGFMIIKAVATLELTQSVQRSHENKDFRNLMDAFSGRSPATDNHSSSEDSKSINEREKLRRMRISKANKGNTPWNKGRKHTPETLQRIRERTRIAMQDPKVRKKLANLGHAQSKETKLKIGVGVRMGWEKRRGKQMLQETCHTEWQNLIAEAATRGFLGEGELQWDSYEILNKQLEQEWLESVEQRKNMPRPKGSKRAPKTLEQRRKIAEAITAKWADPVYRERVYSGIAKYHGIQPGIERKPRKTERGNCETRKRSPVKQKADDTDITLTGTKNHALRSRLKRSNVPLFKDPLASSKLEMIKKIRAQRAAADSWKTVAITKAKLLIAEAEKAAKALEAAATRSPLAQASLLETRKLIAEAISSIEAIEIERTDLYENGACPPLTSAEVGETDDNDNRSSPLTSLNAGHFSSKEDGKSLPIISTALEHHTSKTMDIEAKGFSETGVTVNGYCTSSKNNIEVEDPRRMLRRTVNGTHVSSENDIRNLDFSFLDDSNKVLSPDISNNSLLGDDSSPSSVLESMLKEKACSKKLDQLKPNGSIRHKKNVPQDRLELKSNNTETSRKATVHKTWVCGRLVEVVEKAVSS